MAVRYTGIKYAYYPLTWYCCNLKTRYDAYISTGGTVGQLERLLTSKELAAYLGYSETYGAEAVRQLRVRGTGPSWFRVGRSIRYRESAVRKWIEERERQSTSKRRRAA
jgi:predicted DNA-binding transcriptional regulator AlpA